MVAMIATSAKIFHKLLKKISRIIDVRGVHRVSQHLVWRCCSWLPPQRQRTRREKRDHFRSPPNVSESLSMRARAETRSVTENPPLRQIPVHAPPPPPTPQ